MPSIARSGSPRPPITSTECRHSRLAFDTVFLDVASRRDIGPAAKLVHGALVSQHRLGASWTQTQIGERLGLSRHQVWAAIRELVAAGLVLVTRIGLGRPNEYALCGLPDDVLEGRSPRSGTGRHQDAGRSGSTARHPYRKQEKTTRTRHTAPLQYGQCAGCASWEHRMPECPTYGYLVNH